MTSRGPHEEERSSAFIPRQGESVLAGLRIVRGSAPRILLQDLAETDTPVLKPAGNGGALEGLEPERYQVVGEIARGGVGVIMKGRDADLGRDIAMKLLREEHTRDAQIVQRFVEEAQIDAQLQHPGIVPVYELGLLGKGRPFFTMKLVKGKTFGALLTKRRDATEDRSRYLRIFEKVCQTVAYVHARGVIHRDLKPANMMVGAFGEVLVIDWGFAKVLGREHPASEADAERSVHTVRSGPEGSHSQAGSVMGTPTYMAPEQARGHVDDVDTRADVFALGAILCEILTGEPPYPRESRLALLAATGAHLADAQARLDDEALESELASLAKRCLAEDRGARPHDAGEVAAVMTAYLTSVEERKRQAEVARAAAEEQVRADRRARRLLVSLAGAVLLAMLVGGAAWWLRERDREGRMRQTAEAVDDAVADTQRALGAARSNATHDPSRWAQVERAVAGAQSMLEAGTSDEGTRARVATLAEDVTREAKRARAQAARTAADRTLRERLEHVALAHDRRDVAQIPAIAEAFREYGIDVGALDVDAVAARVRASDAAAALVPALDHWATLEGAYGDGRPPAVAARLAGIADQADDDPTRKRARAAVVARDMSALRRMAAEESDALLATNAATLVCDALRTVGVPDVAASLLQEGIRRHPDSAAFHRQLAELLMDEDPPQRDAAAAHLQAALAVNPESTSVRQQLNLAREAR